MSMVIDAPAPTAAPTRATKVRRTFTIDQDIDDFLQATGNASHTANSLMRQSITLETQQQALQRLLDDLTAETGYEPDPAGVAAARELLRS